MKSYEVSTIFLNQKIKYKNSFRGNNPKVSVVLPIYNQEKYLRTALDSLQNQTLADTEFICVNDGSDIKTDCSLEILHDYANKDKRVKIINQKNQGTGQARNNGIKLADGKYLAFLDPDDWFEPNALELLYQKAEKQNCDMIVFNYKNIDEKTGKITMPFNIGKRLQNFANINVSEEMKFNWLNIKPTVFRGMLWMAWNKMYNLDFIKKSKIHFTKCSLAEDNTFVFGATLKARNIGYTDEYLYNYLQHENSALHKQSDKNFCIFQVIDSVKNLLKNLGLTETLKEEFDQYVLKLISIHSEQILSKNKLKEVCMKRLSPKQIQLLTINHVI